MYRGRRDAPPWEREPSFSGLFRTSKEVLFSPRTFFRDRDQGGGISLPLLFGVIHGTLGGFFPLLWGQALEGRVEEALASLGLAWALFLPLVTALGLFLTSGLIHVGLSLVGGNRGGFRGTFRAVAYSQAAQLWEAIPVVGPIIAALHQISLYLVGLREVHRIGLLRVVLGILLPLLLGGVLLALAFLTLLWPLLRDLGGPLPL